MRLVVALGGNALWRRGEPFDPGAQARRLADVADSLAPLAGHHELIVTHGNGPQVGWLAGQAPADGARTLDVLDAETQGMLGYGIELALASRLPERTVTTLLTRVEVDPTDAAFAKPSKPIGPVLRGEGVQHARRRGWTVEPTAEGARRLVASPDPRALPVCGPVELLLGGGVVVICAGGGGIPVATDADGRQHGIEAVVDKDLTSSLLAAGVRADALLLLTDVEAVFEDWPEPARRPLARATPEQLRGRSFEAGSMAPKVEAACRFVEARGGFAVIGAIERLDALLAGRAGTRVVSTTSGPSEGAPRAEPANP